MNFDKKAIKEKVQLKYPNVDAETINRLVDMHVDGLLSHYVYKIVEQEMLG